MTLKHYAEIYDMWNSIHGMGLSNADSQEIIVRYLERNLIHHIKR